MGADGGFAVSKEVAVERRPLPVLMPPGYSGRAGVQVRSCVEEGLPQQHERSPGGSTGANSSAERGRAHACCVPSRRIAR